MKNSGGVRIFFVSFVFSVPSTALSSHLFVRNGPCLSVSSNFEGKRECEEDEKWKHYRGKQLGGTGPADDDAGD